ncbi:MAG: 3-keto-5-aminohexanoate cleavage protein, partial [Alphaproteobacteria bacterium]|nr:3-keto-5-aminohexanoate cleavage protein [Alphaproteobacteria bacterium]
MDKVFITCAVTGSSPLPDHPNFPITPQQIAEAGVSAIEAGASILHIHVRDPATGGQSTELDLYREAVGLIRQRSNEAILNVTTGPGCTWMQSPDDPALPG